MVWKPQEIRLKGIESNCKVLTVFDKAEITKKLFQRESMISSLNHLIRLNSFEIISILISKPKSIALHSFFS
jgi:hypothetical protein